MEGKGQTMKYTNLHIGQIPTTYKAIKFELFNIGSSAILSLMRCFGYKTGSDNYINQVLVTANLLERISCLVYKGKNGRYKKLSAERYKYEIFEGYAETVEEVFERTKYAGISELDAENIHKMIWQIADVVCSMIACMDEQAFVSEYAYAIDYVIRHSGNLSKPEMGLLFPKNYPEYHYWESPLIEKINTYVDF